MGLYTSIMVGGHEVQFKSADDSMGTYSVGDGLPDSMQMTDGAYHGVGGHPYKEGDAHDYVFVVLRGRIIVCVPVGEDLHSKMVAKVLGVPFDEQERSCFKWEVAPHFDGLERARRSLQALSDEYVDADGLALALRTKDSRREDYTREEIGHHHKDMERSLHDANVRIQSLERELQEVQTQLMHLRGEYP